MGSASKRPPKHNVPAEVRLAGEGGGSSGGQELECESREAKLENVDLQLSARIGTGEVLGLDTQVARIAAIYQGAFLGYLEGEAAQRVLSCIAQGYKFTPLFLTGNLIYLQREGSA